MALMTDIRNNLSKLFGVLAFFFIIMIVFDWGLDLTGRRGKGRGNVEILGSVDGKEIDYRQFSELVRRMSEEQKKRSGIDPDEEVERQIRAQVWNQMVDDILIEKEIERLGITVTDQEIVDILRGPNPPEFLVAQFRDSTGRV
jgi:peptidyl-prolyl cis-trans isomerase D